MNKSILRWLVGPLCLSLGTEDAHRGKRASSLECITEEKAPRSYASSGENGLSGGEWIKEINGRRVPV